MSTKYIELDKAQEVIGELFSNTREKIERASSFDEIFELFCSLDNKCFRALQNIYTEQTHVNFVSER